MIELVKENCGTDLTNQVICIGYSDDFKEKDKLTEIVKEEFNPKGNIIFSNRNMCRFSCWTWCNRYYML